MFNNEEFITNFVAAAKENNEDKMKELAETVTDRGLNDRVELLDALVTALKEEEANEEVAAGLAATLELMKLAAETQNEDSTSEEGKDESKPVEELKDDSADTGADEAKVDAPEASEEGEAPAKEKKAEKSEDKA